MSLHEFCGDVIFIQGEHLVNKPVLLGNEGRTARNAQHVLKIAVGDPDKEGFSRSFCTRILVLAAHGKGDGNNKLGICIEQNYLAGMKSGSESRRIDKEFERTDIT